ncbi:MAG: hypothetical protein JNM10_17665 [Planctomycetia bacterium]|nr:hypothetical protein [Planctomycetia bacterium]
MRRSPFAAAALVAALVGVGVGVRGARAGGDPATTTAADATESGRRIERALDLVLDASPRVASGPRTLAIVLDPSATLAAAGFAERLDAALARHEKALAATEVAVVRVGAKDPVVLPATGDRAAVSAAVRDALRLARNETRNVYADVRAAAQAMAGRAGAREVLLVSLENGDAEDDLEGTVKSLERARVRCFVLAGEAFLSDSYWLSHPRTGAPKGTTLTGGDAAFAEVPWGWLFQRGQAHEESSSGYAPYGLTRLAAATEGRVFLHAGPGGGHKCSAYGVCRFCAGTGDHAPAGEAFLPARLKPLAPSAAARDDVVAAAGRDPAYRLVLATWRKAADAGLVRSRPSIENAGGAWRLARATAGTATSPMSGLAFAAGAARAGKALEALERIRAEHEADLEKLPDGCEPRWRAVAEHVRVMLHVTRVNLVQFVGWCQDAGPAMAEKKERVVEPPEVPWRYGPDTTFVGMSWTDLPLCHGAGPVRELYLPGGPALDRALADLDGVWKAHVARYGGTPFAVAARRASVAQFLLTVRGTVTPPPRPKDGSTTEPPPTTDRPSRDGGGGTSSGPTTSGG